MNILHYCLGFPPFRKGGMVKYCIDLMHCQKEQGHNVCMLWPGAYLNSKPYCKIKYRNINLGIKSYEFINPLPVPLLDGIAEPEYFTVAKDESAFCDFICKEKIDVIHVHTLMGLPYEFIRVAHYAGVKTVFTSHDYFGICPNGSLMQGDELCLDDHNCKDCVFCGKSGLSIKKIKFLQSGIYRKIKNTFLFRWLRTRHLKKHSDDVSSIHDIGTTDFDAVPDFDAAEYMFLREYYIKMLELIDVLHFNSNQSREIYGKYFDVTDKSKVLSISNAGISDNKKLKQLGSTIKMGYLGPVVERRKGYFDLQNALSDLYDQGYKNFELHIYDKINSDLNFLVCHEPYSIEQLASVMDNIDALIVPSIWYETFGFTVLEALSYGVPVIVSDHVGAKDLVIHNKTGIVYKQGTENLKSTLKVVLDDPKVLSVFNENILRTSQIKTIEAHTKEILFLYQVNSI